MSPRGGVDASNVVGSRPDGWWRDRTGATRRLVAALEARGGEGVRVVTSDAELGRRVRALGAEVEGAGGFRRRLD